MTSYRRMRWGVLLSCGWLYGTVWATQAPPPATLAVEGQPALAVVVSDNAPASRRSLATTLADYLGRIAGNKFIVTTGDGTTGLAVGTAADFPALGFEELFEPKNSLRRDEYLLRSHTKGVYLVGATETAASHAVWDLLHRLGCRRYFPTSTWEIVPSNKNLRLAVDALEKPCFNTRMLTYDFGFWDYNKQPFEEWCRCNRVRSDFVLNSGHVYQAIVAANKAVFDAHPEYLALFEGKRVSSKMCLSNPEVQKLVIDFALKHFEKNPQADCVSMEPSDGGKWCECETCKALGSISDRAVLLANRVAEAVNQRTPNKYVGMLAYSLHALPPNLKVNSHVIVSATTHQARGGLTLDQRLQGWRKQGAMIGVSDALCTYCWDHNLPNPARGADLGYFRKQWPHYYQIGARFLSGWTGDAWGAVGLGNYLAARIAWDVKEAERTDQIVAEFMEKCFGPARRSMEKFFHLTYRMRDNDIVAPLSEDLIGRMYRDLDEGFKAAGEDAGIRTRISDLVLYTRYVELYFNYANAKEDRQQRYEKLMKHTYRIRKTEMVHSKAVWSYLNEADKTLKVPEETVQVKGVEQKRAMNWGTPEGIHPWKDPTPVNEAEVRAILAQGIAANQLLDFETRSFSNDLVPAAPLNLAKVAPGRAGGTQVPHLIYTWLEKPGQSFVLKVTGGLIAHFRDRGNVRVVLHSPQAVSDDALYVVADDNHTPPDGKTYEVTFKSPYAGLHWIEIQSGGDLTTVACKDPAQACTLDSSKYVPIQPWSLYFYVPKGTRLIGGYAEHASGALLDADGRKVFDFKTMPKPGHFKAPVPEGQAGKLWKFDGCRGKRILMTVPPYLAETTEQLLLPKEVVAADGLGTAP